MKRLKKCMSLFLTGCLIFALFGCGNRTDNNRTDRDEIDKDISSPESKKLRMTDMLNDGTISKEAHEDKVWILPEGFHKECAINCADTDVPEKH